MDEQQREAVAARLLLAEEDDLLAAIGHFLDRDLGAAPKDRHTLIDSARAWLTQNATELRTLVCQNARIREAVRDDDKLSKVNLVRMTADALISLQKGGVPVIYLATMLVMRGIRNLCHARW